MKRFAMALVAAAAIALGVSAPSAAATDAGWYPKRLTTTVACVRTDFAVTGSGWKVQAAVAAWNDGQSTVRLSFTEEPGCAHIFIHRYSADDGAAAYTDYPSMTVPSDGTAIRYDTVDIYLNDFDPDQHAVALRSRVIIEHELGHALGLPHSTSTRSVMSYGYGPYNLGRWRGVLNPVDIGAVAALYA